MHYLNKIKTWCLKHKEYYVIVLAIMLMGFFLTPYIALHLKSVVLKINDYINTYFEFGLLILTIITSWLLFVRLQKGKEYLSNFLICNTTLLLLIFEYLLLKDIESIGDNTNLFCFYGKIISLDLIIIPYLILLVEKFVHNDKIKLDNDCNNKILVDNPIEESKEDCFGYQYIVDNLIDSFKSLDLREHAYSVGIVGSWGQGKSSLLNLFEKSLNSECIVVRYNPRSAISVSKIQEVFFNVFSNKLHEYNPDIRRIILKYAYALEVIDDSLTSNVVKILRLFKPEKQKEAINNALKNIDKRIYVIIEDLDRLTGEEIIEVLKIIDNNADFTNTIFISAYDKNYVNSVINKYINNSNEQDFTDKYFSYEMPLPIQTVEEIKHFVGNYLQNNIKFLADDLINEDTMIKVWNDNADFVISNLKTMRNIKRFLNLFMYRYAKIKNEVDFRDYLFITLLRYIDLNTYTAICRGKILSSEKYKIYSLKPDINQILTTIGGKKESIYILNKIFPEYNDNLDIKKQYNKINWKNSHRKYFYELDKNTLYYDEMLNLFRQVSDEDAFNKIAENINKIELLIDSIIYQGDDFVCNIRDFNRLFKIAMYLFNMNQRSDLEDFLINLFTDNTYDDVYINKFNLEDYKNSIGKSLISLIPYIPETVANVCQICTDSIVRGLNKTGYFVFTIEYFENIVVEVQKEYYKLWGTEKFFFNYAVQFVNLLTKIDKHGITHYSINTRRELKNLMIEHPNEFAHKLIQVFTIHANSKKIITISFIDVFKVNTIFPIDNYRFEDWINILSEKEKFVINLIYSYMKLNRLSNYSLNIELKKMDYKENDFNSLYEIVKLYKNDDNDTTISYYIKNNEVYDFKGISDETGIAINEVKESIRRLVDKQILESKCLHLKDKMEDFKEGDFVSLSLEEYNKLNNDLPFIIPNIYRIKQILQGNGIFSYSLEGLSKDIPYTSVRPIPIDGVKDKDFYLNTYCAADFADKDGNLPTHKSEHIYYVEEMKTRKDSGDEESYYDKMIKNNCQYVHEVQHLMRELDGGNELELYITA